MLFSFIVPVYNTSKFLKQCMDSLLNQKGADFEIVLVNDGSTDNSGKMCDAYAKQYPNIVRVVHKENEGLLMTRRRGFKESKGDWLICIDSDDYSAEDLLQNVVNAIEQYDPDMVMYNFEYVNDKGEVSKSRLDIANESVYDNGNKLEIYSYKLLTDDINNMWSKAIKREILDIDKDYSNCEIRNMCEDAYQVLPLFTNAEKIVYLSKPLYRYRKGQESITASRSYDNWIASKICFLETEKYLDIWKTPEELRKRFYTHYVEHLSNFLRWAFAQNKDQLEKSLEDIIKIIRTHHSFEKCMVMYDKNYAKTSYLKLSVPIIMRFVKKENIKALRKFFKFERRVLSLK